jgi:hypothetical protein
MIDDFKAGAAGAHQQAEDPRVRAEPAGRTRQVFSGLQDSYEEFYQAVKRSNRVGSTRPLNVHIPVTEIERPMIENVLRKARGCSTDTEEQERIFKEMLLLLRLTNSTTSTGDCIPHMAEMPAASFDLAVFSPPFPALYAYTSSEADIGNSEDLRARPSCTCRSSTASSPAS